MIRSIDAFWKGVKNARINIQRESGPDNHQKLVSSTSASDCIPRRQNTPDSEDSVGIMTSDSKTRYYIREVSRLPAKNPRPSQVLSTSSVSERIPVNPKKAKICAASSGVSLGQQVMGLGILGSRKWDMPVAMA